VLVAQPALGAALAGVDGGAVRGRGGVAGRQGDDRAGASSGSSCSRTCWCAGASTCCAAAGSSPGLLLFALASLPWHHAMALYRGKGWINELIVINNLARFGSGEQEQAVGGFAYYVRTLGVAALPWSAALPAALWAAMRGYETPGRRTARRSGCVGGDPGCGAAALRAAVGGGDPGAADLQRDQVLSLPAAGAAAAGGAGRAVAGGADRKDRARATSGKTAGSTAGVGVGVLGLVLRDAVGRAGVDHPPDDVPVRQHVAARARRRRSG
jgi:hypothetical protein